MTDQDRPAVEQVDRDAAAALMIAEDGRENEWTRRMVVGWYDDALSVQAFARHRLAAVASVQAELAKADQKRRRLEAARRGSRGWVITFSESAQARRAQKTIDAALGLNAPPQPTDAGGVDV